MDESRFKTGENSASPNVNYVGKNNSQIKKPIRATMQFGDKRDNQPNGKGNVKRQG